VAVIPDLGDYFTELPTTKLAAFCRVPAAGLTVKRLGDASRNQLLGQGIREENIRRAEVAGRLPCLARPADERLRPRRRGAAEILAKPHPPPGHDQRRADRGTTDAPSHHGDAGAIICSRSRSTEINEFYSAAVAAGVAIAVNRKPGAAPAGNPAAPPARPARCDLRARDGTVRRPPCWLQNRKSSLPVPVGVGKTTAINSISDIPTVGTEARATDETRDAQA